MKIDENALRVVLGRMPDGFVFEKFAHKIFSIVFGDEFIPVGGSGDQGIDGLQYVYERKKSSKLIYQISTEKVHWKQKDHKITTTQDKLIQNKIHVDKLHYITNRKVDRKDEIQDEFYSLYHTSLTIYDREWFVVKISSDPRIADIYKSFVETHVHEYQKPGKFIEVGEFSKDPRLYVFLRQQVDEGGDDKIEEKIIEGLILYVLEETSPEKEIFKTENQVIEDIKNLTNLGLVDYDDKIKKRLATLAKKPNRKINYYSDGNKFCLPFDTRLKLVERNIKDIKLQEDFQIETLELLKTNLKVMEVQTKEVYALFEKIIHGIYYRQGLEFSNFILSDIDKTEIDDSLRTIVSSVVDDSPSKIENKAKIKTALLMSLREVAYNGSFTQREYLRRLSKTYMMIFLTQNDPKISLFFQSLANKLDVFVGTSIIIPAISEYFLEPENKRYWNLLKGAKSAGVSLKINEYIVGELVRHFKSIKKRYNSLYQQNEDDYVDDEINILYIDEILIRAYYYAKMRNKVTNFNSFIMKFAEPSLSNLKEDIIFYLKEEFGMEYVTTSSQKVTLDQEEISSLIEHLKEKKRNVHKTAEVDAKLILHIYKLRESNNETDSAGIFGYKTWWLSQDINTFKSVRNVFPEKYTVSCYMRADFLYKYISLSPQREEIDLLYKQCFPNLMGVNLSYHIPKGISDFVSQKILEHKETNPQIVRRTLKNLTERLMSSIEGMSKKDFKSFFDEEMKRLTSEENHVV